MQGDDDLRARFRSLANEDASGEPPFPRERIDAARRTPHASRAFRAWYSPGGFALAGASLVAAAIVLAIGIVLGANTGYASARLAGDRQRDEMAAATSEVKRQITAMRASLARVRSDLARRARNGDDATRASLVFAESELRSMEASAERIDLDLVDRRSTPAPLPPMQLVGFPVKRALAITCGALAQPVPPPKQGVPVVDLPAATVMTRETFGGILGLRQSSDGSVLVNDAARRQITLFDTTLATSTVVMDSTPGTSTSYGQFATALIPFLGDSSLFGDRPTQTMLVLDGRGRVARSLALPRRLDFFAVNSGPSAMDAEGRLVYRGMRPMPGMHMPLAPQTMGLADSIPILRADLDFRRIDTIGRIARPVMKVMTQPTSDGKIGSLWTVDPLQSVDEWAVLSNGAVAFVRGHDYHVDWIQAGGSAMATPKLPFDWKRLGDDDKARVTDSVRAGQNALLANGYPQAEYGIFNPCGAPATNGPPPGATGRAGNGGAPPADMDRSGCAQVIQTSYIPAVGGVPARAISQALPPFADLIRAGPVADYRAPIGINSTLADRDGNLWILPRLSTLSKNGELVYDVVNAEGKLFERVRLPAGRAIAGFGKGGVVYLTSGDRASGFHLERTKLPPRATSPK
ncbi:MAG: hypothetical protein ABJF01_23815 [bacterium]